jgi:hypothetical protein
MPVWRTLACVRHFPGKVEVLCPSKLNRQLWFLGGFHNQQRKPPIVQHKTASSRAEDDTAVDATYPNIRPARLHHRGQRSMLGGTYQMQTRRLRLRFTKPDAATLCGYPDVECCGIRPKSRVICRGLIPPSRMVQPEKDNGCADNATSNQI